MAALQYKDDHNRIAYLGRERGSEDFTDILSYLDHSPLRYALTHDPPVVFDSLVKQFWATATVRPNAAGSHDLVATIDGREVVVTESLIRAQLQLDDANGIFDMQIDDIFAGMGAIGYPPGRTLTFLKHHFSPQWRFLVHTILHCLSPKAGSWNQFPSSIATALVCLSTGRVYNFSRFILEGMIANVKTKKNKFLMYPRFLQMLVAIETADRTPRPTSAFTRKLFSNMRLKWAGEEIPLTPPMLAIAAAGDAADEQNAAANEAAGSTAEAHPAPHSPPFSPVRESSPERQPETEWVVPNPVSPGTDWRPWPSVPPPRTPTPPAQTLSFEEPLVFGPVPKPAGYVDPDTIDPIIFGPPPRPYDFVDPALEEPVIFGPLPRPANYIEPEDIDNLNSMEDDTILGGFHEETHVGPDDAPTTTADAAGRAEDPALLTSLSAKIDRCMGRIDLLETELGTSKKIMGGAILTLVSRVKKLERTVKQLRSARLVGDAPATEGDVDIQDAVDLEGLSRMASEALGHDQTSVPSEDMEEREEEEVPLRRKSQDKSSILRLLRASFNAPSSSDVLPQADISDIALPSHVPAATTQPADDHDSAGGSSFHMLVLALFLWLCLLPFCWWLYLMFLFLMFPRQQQWICCSHRRERGINEFFLASDEDEQIGMSRVAADPDSDDEVLAEILFRGQSISGNGVVLVDKLPDDEIVDPRVKDDNFEDFFSLRVESEMMISRIYSPIPENRRHKNFFYLKELLPHVYREDLLLLRRRMNRYFRLNPDVDVGLDLWRDVNLLCQSLHSDDVDIDDFLEVCGKGFISAATILEVLTQQVTVPPLTVGMLMYLLGMFFSPLQGWPFANYECLASAPLRVNTPGSDENRLKFFDLMYILVNGAVAAKSGSCCLEMLLPHLILLFIEFMLVSFDAAVGSSLVSAVVLC
ncbi:hypothetical protein Tco_0562118 [Tanacetum coccineum]